MYNNSNINGNKRESININNSSSKCIINRKNNSVNSNSNKNKIGKKNYSSSGGSLVIVK